MNWEFVIKIAMFTVGVTSMLKQLLSLKSAKLKVVLTIIVGIIGGFLLTILPEQVFLTIMGIALAVVFYDSILKTLEKVLRGAEQ